MTKEGHNGRQTPGSSTTTTRLHTALSIRQYLAQRNVPMLEQPPYSPDLAPSDFFLFPKLKTVLKGTRFPDLETLKRAATKEQRAFQKEPSRSAWKRGIGGCTSVSIAEGNTLKDFELKFQFSNVIKFWGNKSRYFLDTPRI